MTKILCITGAMGSGGAETFMMKLFRNINKKELHIDFCVSVDHESLHDKEILASGSKIHHITAKTVDAKKYKKDLIFVLKSEKYDVVFRLGDTCFSFFDLFIAKKCGVKKLGFRSCNSNFHGSKLHLTLHKLLRGFLSPFIHIKFAPSTEAALFTFGKHQVKKGNVHILHNGVNLPDFMYSHEDRNEARKELNIENKFVVGHIGRFFEQKNHSFIIDTFAEIHKKNKNSTLLLIGVGVLMDRIKEKVEDLGLTDSVIFSGERKDIGKLLSAMDVFLFPSFFEGMPNTVIEAQANGLSCIISDSITPEANITGLVEYVSLSKNAEYWADKVLNADTNHKNTTEAFIKAHYEIKTVADEFVSYMVMS